jgi:hypothetical protein
MGCKSLLEQVDSEKSITQNMFSLYSLFINCHVCNQSFIFNFMIGLWGENMKKGVSRAKVKVFFKDCIFHTAIFY